MPRHSSEILGEPAVYPGHPIVVAYCIMVAFENASRALARTEHNVHAALGSLSVPGGGDGAYGGCDVIRKLRDGESVEDVIGWSADKWTRMVGPTTGNHTHAYGPGIAQAARFEEAFRAKVQEWL